MLLTGRQFGALTNELVRKTSGRNSSTQTCTDALSLPSVCFCSYRFVKNGNLYAAQINLFSDWEEVEGGKKEGRGTGRTKKRKRERGEREGPTQTE